MAQADNIIPRGYLEFSQALRLCYDEATSSAGEWDQLNPEKGQCAVAALLFQEHFGGELKRATVNGESHYWNELAGVTIDLTRSQFLEPLEFGETVTREREYVLSFPATLERYELLKWRFHKGFESETELSVKSTKKD